MHDNESRIYLKINIFENYFITEDNIKINYLKLNNVFYININNCIKKFYIKYIFETYLLILETIYFKTNILNLENITNIDSYISVLNNINKSTETINIIYNNFKFEIDDNIFKSIYNDLIFILNVDSEKILNKILTFIPKSSHIIINLKFNMDVDLLINNYKNLIITKSYNIIDYYTIKYIYENIIPDDNCNIYKIFYINKDDDIENNIIDIQKYIKNTIFYNNIKKNVFEKDNYLYNLLFFTLSFNELILIFIFYYFLNKNIYNFFDNNFITDSNLLKKILDDKFNKYVYYIK
jgi:hypothetical protein